MDSKKEIIPSGWENIATVEIEKVIYRHPDVLEVAVIRVPDSKWGEVPKAFIVPKPGKNPSAEDIMKFCGEHLAHFNIPVLNLVFETKDPYSPDHQKRVAKLAAAIAGEMGLSENQTEVIRLAGGIHDLGKISVPADILSKPARLSEIEYSLMKIHPEAGYNILKDIDIPWPIALIVLQHHERLDGSGYPGGLKEGDIILEARIMAVADVVEAIASYRPYRPILGTDKALDEISKNRGVLYDPQVADACLTLFQKKGFSF
jgi:HD-GYP domain-containing protein (c-di-GMP phosphodiesterase class II)